MAFREFHSAKKRATKSLREKHNASAGKVRRAAFVIMFEV